ncbi:hypothetical protein AGOR_G00149780 [Albula goreensis]|uniref:Flavin-containing monooxygenase n=1 Tax=Albula goreensis TaxID=1534307 RepID=A0A8T3D311_9TELE|nr:hypothetical protein AGOR_G00149780 [Albula goreensis]
MWITHILQKIKLPCNRIQFLQSKVRVSAPVIAGTCCANFQSVSAGFRQRGTTVSSERNTMARRVAVIGAGCAGLTSIKCCLDEGLEPVCFESSNDIGGLWKYKDRPEPERCSIYRSLVVNTSKEMMCFSDFPMPDHYPNYMHNSQYLQYLRLYAAHFDLLKHIRFQTTVCAVKQMPDFSDSGQWEVETENKEGEKERHIFDAVLVCSGHYTHPVTPLKTSQLGLQRSRCSPGEEGCCGGDRKLGRGHCRGDQQGCTENLPQHTARRLGHRPDVQQRAPSDMIMITRFRGFLPHILPRALLNWVGERGLNQRFDHRIYGLLPMHRLLDQRPLINDDLPGRILMGAVVMKPNLKEFRGSSLVFEDGSVEDQIDAVIFCTGYSYSFPFLPTSLFPGPGHELTLYQHVFPPALEHPTLAVLGLFQAKGPIMPVMELQARWATRVFAGLNKLPPKEKMLEITEAERRRNMKSSLSSKHSALQVDFTPYLDYLAGQVGALPNFLGLLLRDPRLGLNVLLGPCTPYQYRLYGPGQWTGARQAILTQWDRVTCPFKTRPIPEPRHSSSILPLLLTVSGASLLFAVIYSPSRITTMLQDLQPF